MNILFVTYSDFQSNSSIHVFGFANQLARFGHDCCVAVPMGKESVSIVGQPLFKVREYSDFGGDDTFFDNKAPADVIHAWTPRERVRLFVETLRAKWKSRLVVHLEDNEEHIAEVHLETPIVQLLGYSAEKLDATVPPLLSHPVKYRRFLESADGVTVIIDRLREFVPNNVPGYLLWPGVDFGLFNPDVKARAVPGVSPMNSSAEKAERVIVYTGNVHTANWPEVLSLYRAVHLLNQRGVPTKLVRTGIDYHPFLDQEPALKQNEIPLGFLKWEQIPAVLAAADVLVQPGAENVFNAYRLPSKLPEFLSMGKPVMLPEANLGLYLRDSHDCILLRGGGAEEIATCAQFLFQHDLFRRHIAGNGLVFAREKFKWESNTAGLVEFYEAVQKGEAKSPGYGAKSAAVQDSGTIQWGDANAVGQVVALTRSRSESVLRDYKEMLQSQEQALAKQKATIALLRDCIREHQAFINAQREGYQHVLRKSTHEVNMAKIDFESRIAEVRGTKSWRLMRLLRRIKAMILRGEDGGIGGFFRWLLLRPVSTSSHDPFDGAKVFALDPPKMLEQSIAEAEKGLASPPQDPKSIP